MTSTTPNGCRRISSEMPRIQNGRPRFPSRRGASTRAAFRSSQRQASASGKISATSFSARGRLLTEAAASASASAFSAIRWRKFLTILSRSRSDVPWLGDASRAPVCTCRDAVRVKVSAWRGGKGGSAISLIARAPFAVAQARARFQFLSREGRQNPPAIAAS